MTHVMEHPREILKARAIELARPLAQQQHLQEMVVVEFRLATERYAVERAYATGIQSLQSLVPLPGAPPFLRGIIHVRGQILPVIDLKQFFELPAAGITDLHAVITVKSRDVEVGILVDVVDGIRAVPLDAIQASLPTLTEIRADYLKGVAPGALVVLDVPRMLADPRMIVRQEPVQSIVQETRRQEPTL